MNNTIKKFGWFFIILPILALVLGWLFNPALFIGGLIVSPIIGLGIECLIKGDRLEAE